MSKVEKLHTDAMDIAEEAFCLQRRGNADKATELFVQALELERQAAASLPLSDESEPTRSILYRSAASLAYNALRYDMALSLIEEGLKGSPPSDVEEELSSLRNEIDLNKQSKQFTGLLKLADSREGNSQYGIVQLLNKESDESISVHVPASKMRDIVRAYFDELVVITGYQQGRYTYLENIEIAYS